MSTTTKRDVKKTPATRKTGRPKTAAKTPAAAKPTGTRKRKPVKQKTEPTGAVRCVRIEIRKMPEDRRTRWRELCLSAQRITNRMWQIWIKWHLENDSETKLRAHFELYNQWKTDDKKTRGAKPPWPVQAVGKELAKEIYHSVSKSFPDVHARTRVLIANKWKSTVDSRKSTRFSLKGWVAILYALESVPSFHKPLPIPFDKVNCPKNVPLHRDADDVLTLSVRLDRNTDDGTSPIESFPLGKLDRYSRVVVERLLSGAYDFKGSAIEFRKGKFFALISYQMPPAKRSNLDPEKVLTIFPARNYDPADRIKRGVRMAPWIFLHRGDRARRGGHGRHIIRFRKMVQQERATRKEHYRWAGSDQKGRGGKRARAAWTKLSSRWKNFVRNYNHEMTRLAVRTAMFKDCGKIVYYQPKDERRDGLFLTDAGRDDRSKMTWDYFQFGTFLKNKCHQEGIEVEIREWLPRKKPVGPDHD